MKRLSKRRFKAPRRRHSSCHVFVRESAVGKIDGARIDRRLGATAVRGWKVQDLGGGGRDVRAVLLQVRQHAGRVGGVFFEFDEAQGDGGDGKPKPAIGTRWQIRPVVFEREAAKVAIGAGKNGDGTGRFHALLKITGWGHPGPARLARGWLQWAHLAARARPHHGVFRESQATYSAGALASIEGASKQSLSGTGRSAAPRTLDGPGGHG